MYTEEDLAALSNHQLFNALKDLGAEVGPVVGTDCTMVTIVILCFQFHSFMIPKIKTMTC